MATHGTGILTGTLVLDKNGERFFLSTRADLHTHLGPRLLTGSHVLRLISDDFAVFPQDLLAGQSRDVTVSGHIATEAEMRLHDQLTDPSITAERIVSAEAIRKRAFEIFQSGRGGSALDDWLRAERELLGLTA